MKHSIPFLAFVLPFAVATGAADPAELEQLFTLKVKPMLTEKCLGCHGDEGKKLKGGLDVTTREKLLQGGEDFPDTLVPGSAAKSFLMAAVKWEDPDYEMPPKENDRLTEEQIDHIARWIDGGAPWPNEARQNEIRVAERQKRVTADGTIWDTSGGLGDDWTYRRYKPEDVWAFRPLTRPTPPFGSSHPVDAFIDASLREAGFAPAKRADPRTLIRRATYDLTGLPPKPKEVHDFTAAARTDPEAAWGALIDRLLASPQYGERWGQHWLDVARYADTAGLSNDYERSNTWRYRDYVIRALNEDMPYNQFIVEQIAGDELADESLRKRSADTNAFEKARREGQYTEEESEWLVASTFLRIGPWDPAMVKVPDARQQYLDDVVNAVGQTFLSTTMRCFKCHDHKFDPLPTKDYYRMYSVFAATQLAERPAPFTTAENREGFEESKAMVKHLHAFTKEKLNALNAKSEAAARKWYRENGTEFVSKKGRKALPDEEKPPRHVGLDETEKGRLKVREQDDWIWTRRLERYQPLVQSVYSGPTPKALNSRKMRMPKQINPEWKLASTILTGGSLEAPGKPVTPGVLSALGVPTPTSVADDPFALPREAEGRRLALARWVADERNPLTSRSIVNRIWQYHFGKAIAGNPNNFGAKGKKPTHPELLDWLASDFIEHGWTMKRMHRTIMTSEVYRRAGQAPKHEELRNADPNNDLFATFPNRRLTAEELRDGMLRVTGELNLKQGGLPIKPEMNMEVALQPRMIQFSVAPAYQPSPTPAQRNRRSIYAYRVRGLAHPFLETFNQPNPNDSCEERDAASVSPQAFTLLNSDLVTDRSVALALRLEKEREELTEQITRAYHLAYTRQPSKTELEAMTTYVKDMVAYHKKNPATPRNYPTQIERTLVEEFSGQPFNYQEILPVFENYTPDPHSADVSPETRALADFCLLLFNSHEFVYLY